MEKDFHCHHADILSAITWSLHLLAPQDSRVRMKTFQTRSLGAVSWRGLEDGSGEGHEDQSKVLLRKSFTGHSLKKEAHGAVRAGSGPKSKIHIRSDRLNLA